MEAYAYDPFGRPINGQISDNRFRYLGRHGVMDEENGFLYIHARYYSTRRGRFTTKDPTTGTDGDSQSMNRYIYALNNPVRLIDISGLSAQETSGQTLSFATSDNSLLHNYLISPSTSGLATQTAGSTPQFVSGGSSLGDRIISLGDVVSTAGSSQAAINLFQFTTSQQQLLSSVGDITGVIGLAGNAVQANGGINNTIAAFANAGSNIQWLFQGATTDDLLNFGITASTQVTAVTINAIASPVYSAINLFTGQNISVTGSEVQSAVQSYVNFFQVP
jgi:RHS repeat-associated protein